MIGYPADWLSIQNPPVLYIDDTHSPQVIPSSASYVVPQITKLIILTVLPISHPNVAVPLQSPGCANSVLTAKLAVVPSPDTSSQVHVSFGCDRETAAVVPSSQVSVGVLTLTVTYWEDLMVPLTHTGMEPV